MLYIILKIDTGGIMSSSDVWLRDDLVDHLIISSIKIIYLIKWYEYDTSGFKTADDIKCLSEQ